MHTYHWADWAPFGGEIPIWVSLTVIVVTLVVTTVASLIKSRYDDDQRPDREQETTGTSTES
jgi:tellurite resistance protein TerC